MGWFSKFLTSSLGQKVVMSLTGLFLIVFLVVHLAGNLQLLADDGGRSFNEYAHFMTHSPLIKTISYLLYAFILLHAFQGWALWRKNRLARGAQPYAVHRLRAVNTNPRIASRMGWIGTVIFVFILVHMYQFWFKMKIGDIGVVRYDGQEVKDLYTLVATTYQNLGFVLFYVVSMVVIGAHLWHGFQSSFQTLGINHSKYSPLIHFLGKLYAIVIPLGFALIPIVFFVKHA